MRRYDIAVRNRSIADAAMSNYIHIYITQSVNCFDFIKTESFCLQIERNDVVICSSADLIVQFLWCFVVRIRIRCVIDDA